MITDAGLALEETVLGAGLVVLGVCSVEVRGLMAVIALGGGTLGGGASADPGRSRSVMVSPAALMSAITFHMSA